LWSIIESVFYVALRRLEIMTIGERRTVEHINRTQMTRMTRIIADKTQKDQRQSTSSASSAFYEYRTLI
jgi:hypothetical protein